MGRGLIIDPRRTHPHQLSCSRRGNQDQVAAGRWERYPATLIGGDPKTDLAVIKISAKEPLPHVTFGDSDKVEVGEWVVAIGTPRGLEKSVTQGIISAKHRRGIKTRVATRISCKQMQQSIRAIAVVLC